MSEESNPRLQGSDDDQFQSAMPDVVYDQADGERMAQTIKLYEQRIISLMEDIDNGDIALLQIHDRLINTLRDAS